MKRLLSFFSILLFLVLVFLSKDALALQAGSYQLLIQPTPTQWALYWGEGTDWIITNWGTNGHYNSSFSFGLLPGNGSQPMTDLTGDGWAGVVGISVDGSGNVTVTSFQKDDILGTAGGTFGQFGTITGVGSNVGTSLTLDPTGRKGSFSAFPSLYGSRWNYDDFKGQNSYDLLTTSTASWTDTSGTKTVAGTPIYTDSNGNLWASLVSGGYVGSDWGGFWGAPYFEIWKVKIVAVVPEPASILLIGTGLIGLIGVVRRRNK